MYIFTELIPANWLSLRFRNSLSQNANCKSTFPEMLTVYSIAFPNIQEYYLFLALYISKTSSTKTSILPGKFQNSKLEFGRFNIRPSGVSLKCKYHSIHKVRTNKAREGSVNLLFQWAHCFAKMRTEEKAGVKKLNYLSVRSL